MKRSAVPQIQIEEDFIDENDEDLMEAFDFDENLNNLNEDESLADVNINDISEIFSGSLEEKLRSKIKRLQELRKSHMRKICTLQRLIGRLKKRNTTLLETVNVRKKAKKDVAVNTTDDVFFLL